MRSLLLLALALPACHPCVEVCNDQVSAYEACLGDWDLGWADLGAQDATDWWQQCTDDQGVWEAGLSSEASDTEGAQCGGLRDRLRTSIDCEAKWAAIVQYGVE